MVEPVSLTLGAIAAALVARAADETAERVVEGGAGALGKLVSWLRSKFSNDDDEYAATALARVEDAPDSPSRLNELAEVLDWRVDDDEQFGSELKALVDEAHGGGVDVGSIAQAAWGNQNVQAARVVGSQITVTYGQPPSAR